MNFIAITDKNNRYYNCSVGWFCLGLVVVDAHTCPGYLENMNPSRMRATTPPKEMSRSRLPAVSMMRKAANAAKGIKYTTPRSTILEPTQLMVSGGIWLHICFYEQWYSGEWRHYLCSVDGQRLLRVFYLVEAPGTIHGGRLSWYWECHVCLAFGRS